MLNEIDSLKQGKNADGHYSAIELVIMRNAPINELVRQYLNAHLDNCEHGCPEMMMGILEREQVFVTQFEKNFEEIILKEGGISEGE